MVGLFDIHTHILPDVDDGSKNIEESIKLLELLKSQGIMQVIATPHFYPMLDSLDEFKDKTKRSYKLLTEAVKGKRLPKIYLGSEVLYYSGISRVTSLDDFLLNNSRYLLLELSNNSIDDNLFSDIRRLKESFGIKVIIAHIERYHDFKNYKKLISFVKKQGLASQINAESFFSPFYKKAAISLVKKGMFTVVSTDTHSVDSRPPMYANALNEIRVICGDKAKEKLLENSDLLYKEIILKE